MKFIFLAIFITMVHCYVDPIVLVHGGADNMDESKVKFRIDGVKRAAMTGHKVLKNGGSPADAVEAAIKILEDDESFNAGRGANLNSNGEAELDAGIMIGFNLSSGGVSALKNVANPISVARLVMEKSPHFLLSGEGAKDFAKRHGIDTNVPMSYFITDDSKQKFKAGQKEFDYLRRETGCGSVGVIAMDKGGHLAAASSTGGRILRFPGRVSDASIVGAGLYADDDVGAVVVTGHGEAIARSVMAYEIISAMKKGFDAGLATRNTVKTSTTKFRKQTGAITVSKTGQIGISFTTQRMAWAYQIRDDIHYGADDYDHMSERFKL